MPVTPIGLLDLDAAFGVEDRTMRDTVRRYVERSSDNDRRRDLANIRLNERRADERRGHAVRRVHGARKELVFTPVKAFARIHPDGED